MTLSPIVLFVYNRPEHTLKTLEALSRNILAKESDLFIFADGPKENSSSEILSRIKATRLILREKQWCKSVTIEESNVNKGLASSIISGVTKIVNKYGTVIVLEDDIVTGVHFLEYMNEALTKYIDKKEVWHITGYRYPVKTENNDFSFFYPVMDCWSWATWKDRWQFYKKDCDYYIAKFTDKMRFDFNIRGSDTDMWTQIEQNKSGQINTWAIFWYATIFERNGLCLAPSKSLVRNIGLDNSGVHCVANPREEIKKSIDHKIVSYPFDILINTIEYQKNIVYMNYPFNKSTSLMQLILFFAPKHLIRVASLVKNFLYTLFRFVFPIKPLGTIFMLHRVSEWEVGKLFANENMKVSPKTLESFLLKISKERDIVRMEELPTYLQTKHKKKFAVFTMDDGYKDNLTEGLVIFKKYNVPYTIFIAGTFPEQKAILWWYELEDLILSHDKILLSNNFTYETRTKEQKEKAFLDIRLEILKLNQENLIDSLNELFCNYQIDWSSKCESLCLSWDEINTLKNESLVTIGAHTMHHFNLRQLFSEDDVRKEINDGLSLFNDKSGFTPTVFAYPFGSPNEVSERETKILSTMNFKTSLLAFGGDINNQNKNDYSKLPRVMLTESYLKEFLSK